MDAIVNIPTVALAIQQAVAPVFLLTGVGAMLGVMTNRLGRTVDRFRRLGEIGQALHAEEMAVLSRRARWIHWAISLCTLCALFISIAIVLLFVGVALVVDLSDAVAMLFVAAMLALICGLMCFLREITLATGIIDMHRFHNEQRDGRQD